TDTQVKELSFFVYQPIVNSPAIDSNAMNGSLELTGSLACFTQSRFDLLENPWQVPTEVTIKRSCRVMEPAHFLKQEFSGSDPSQKHSSAPSTQINCDVERLVHQA